MRAAGKDSGMKFSIQASSALTRNQFNEAKSELKLILRCLALTAPSASGWFLSPGQKNVVST
jgi:hypothetical protein